MSWSIAIASSEEGQVALRLMRQLGYERQPWPGSEDYFRPFGVYRLDLVQASMGDFNSRKRISLRYPVHDGKSIMFFDVTCARRLTLLEAELRYPHPHFSIYKGMNDAADFAMTRRKHFVLHVFEVPALDLTAIWLRHAKEHWFLEMGAGKDGADAVTGEDFEAKVVGEAISRLRISAELSVFDQDPGAADAA